MSALPSPAEDTQSGPLLTFVLTMLASMMAPTLADAALARLAAREAVEMYRTRGRDEWLTIGQIVGFAVAALDTLRLSMPADVPVPLKLRLRSNANGLNRSSCACRRLLETGRACERVGGVGAKADVDGGAAPVTEAPVTGGLTGTDWADAMQTVAATLETDAATVSSEQREIDAVWIVGLIGGGGVLRGGPPAAPGGGTRSRLMATFGTGGPPGLFGKGQGKRKRGGSKRRRSG